MLSFRLKRLARSSRSLGRFLLLFLGLHILPSAVRLAVLPRLNLPKDYGPVLLRKTLEDLGGMYVKLGQILSMRFDYLPVAYCMELFRLLDRVPPFETRIARRIIQEELGKDVVDFATSFDPEPIASASFGQVYRAALNGGEDVVIKVQRPQIEQLIRADLLLLSVLVRLIDLTTVLGKITLWPLFQDLRETTLNEIDYRREAHNASRFHENFEKSRLARSPEVYFQYSTKRVLVMERLEGIWMKDLLEGLETNPADASLSAVDTDALAKNLLRATLQQVFEGGFFHADPHPANLLVLADARIGYIDFGIMGRMPSEFQTKMLRYFLSLANRDVDSAYKHFIAIVQPPSDKDLARLEKEFKANATEWFDVIGFHESSTSQRSATRMLLRNIEIIRKHNLRLPDVVLNFYRTLAIVDMLFNRLSPRSNVLVDMEKSLLEIVLRRSFVGGFPGKALRLLIDYHELVHSLPNKLNDAIETVQTERYMTSRNVDTHSLLYRWALVLSWLSALSLVGYIIFLNLDLLVEAVSALQLSETGVCIILVVLFLILQWVRRLLSRRF